MKLDLSKFSELQKRVIAGAIGATVLINAVYWSEWSYFIVFLLIGLLAQVEFYQLLGLEGKRFPLKSFGTFIGMLMFILTFIVERGELPAIVYYWVFVILSGVYFIKLYVKTDLKPFANIAFTFLGIIYVALPFALLNTVIFEGGQYHFEVVLGCLLLLWANDSGAYFSGRMFGKRKLFLRISPKKTWEGSIGGGLLSMAVGYAISHFFGYLPSWQWFGISLIIVVAGTYGDLVESLFKRSMRIKDSGDAIPGHGGFLDRFDSLLLAAPFIVAFLKTAKYF